MFLAANSMAYFSSRSFLQKNLEAAETMLPTDSAMKSLIFSLIIWNKFGVKEISLLTHKIFMPEVELKVEIMLEHLVACVKKIVEVHSVLELVSSRKVRNDHLEFWTSGGGEFLGRLDWS